MIQPRIGSTIVSTALPRIVTELSGEGYTWIAASYLLAAAAMTPLSGKICDSFGAKYAVFSGIFIFLLGSGLAGGSQTMNWLIATRAVQVRCLLSSKLPTTDRHDIA